MDAKYIKVLKTRFGHDKFRPYQFEIINTIIEKKQDICAIFATGYGKSLCYQFPSVYLNGITFIVSPLIALMTDQVNDLIKKGIQVCSLNSTIKNQTEVLQDMSTGKYDLVYVTPEYISKNKHILEKIHKDVNIDLFAIDEAHCVSYMGHSFREDYRTLKIFKEWFPQIPVLAVTATATENIRQDICKSLQLKEPLIIYSTFDRPNLYLEVSPKYKQKATKLKSVLPDIQHILKHKESTIIYVLTRAKAEAITDELQISGYDAETYHAGINPKLRESVQNRFMDNETDIIVATIAFGLGINKPDIRTIINYGCPKNISSYYQQIGRASRDGKPGKCYLFYEEKDISTNLYFIQNITDETFKRTQTQMLAKIKDFLYTKKCRHKFIVHHFEKKEDVKCINNCDNCISNNKREQSITKLKQYLDCTLEAELILKAIKKTGGKYGIQYPILILRGSNAKKVKDVHKQLKSIYGQGKQHNAKWWTDFTKKLIRKKYLEEEMNTYISIQISDKGRDWLRKINHNMKMKI